MQKFKGLTGDKAKLEFALSVLHAMPAGDAKALDALFDEAKAGTVLDDASLEDLREHAKRILPVKFMYDESEKEQMKEFQDYRDKILALCH